MSKNKIVNVYKSDKEVEISHEGEGIIQKIRAFNTEDFKTSIDFIDYIIVPSGASVGVHKHGLNEEVYFVISGKGEMIINSKERNVKSGDIIVNPLAGIHGLVNNSENEMRILIFQVSL